MWHCWPYSFTVRLFPPLLLWLPVLLRLRAVTELGGVPHILIGREPVLLLPLLLSLAPFLAPQAITALGGDNGYLCFTEGHGECMVLHCASLSWALHCVVVCFWRQGLWSAVLLCDVCCTVHCRIAFH